MILRATGLPSIPWAGLFLGSSELPNQLLAAPANRLPQFGEGAAALQVVESVLSRAAVLGPGPAGTAVAWRHEDT